MPPDLSAVPRAREYLKRLPRGLDSFPQCRMKASILQEMMAREPFRGVGPDVVPQRVLDVASAPLLPSTWLPTVLGVTMVLAATDLAGFSDEEHLARVDASDRRLMGGRLYRTILALASPSLLLRVASARFGAFHQGPTLEVTELHPRSGSVTLRFPSFLFESLLLRGFAVAFRVALETSRAYSPTVELEDFGERHARFRAAWQ